MKETPLTVGELKSILSAYKDDTEILVASVEAIPPEVKQQLGDDVQEAISPMPIVCVRSDLIYTEDEKGRKVPVVTLQVETPYFDADDADCDDEDPR